MCLPSLQGQTYFMVARLSLVRADEILVAFEKTYSRKLLNEAETLLIVVVYVYVSVHTCRERRGLSVFNLKIYFVLCGESSEEFSIYTKIILVPPGVHLGICCVEGDPITRNNYCRFRNLGINISKSQPYISLAEKHNNT